MNLKELSEKLGLSQTTVSRALNGYPEVRESTRQKVLEAARAHNYAPNTRAKTLATGRAMTIGHVLPVSKKHEMVNPIFADFIAGAGEIYSDNGYDLLLSVVNDEDEEASYRKLISRGAVDGVIVHGPKVNDRRIALLQELGVPFVVHGRSTEVAERYSWVDVNNKRAFQRATEFLLDLGHRRIALLNGLADMDFATRRGAGYVAALDGREVPVRQELIFHDEMTENYGYETCRKALAMEKPPTAFVVSSIIPAIGLRRALSEAGLKMGRDVSVVIHDDALSYFGNEGDVPAFTAVRSSVREAGRKVAGTLIDMISKPGSELRQEMLEATLTVGQSTGPAPAVRQVLAQED
ncbi:substrate-binding domain-containing protein [Shimia sp. R9_1]|uniref:substrate-binding domain-containing protein n=1 Tax=Shimia sp. R9_1 TaxID=2821111 RepID=UPI001AD9FDA1|nr:substrate-binding domain-containing protein [Shimia sp. R9_1]MBO9407269.1 substrate-binding domain-containing protein [Shimia sp. R9_1]